MAYYRVSTDRQGKSGLGLEAQRKAVADHLDGGKWDLVGEFTEVESGKRSDRPELARALALCRKHKAALIIAKLDRLARNARFLLTVVEGTGERGVVFCDLPQVPPGAGGKFVLTLFAAVAELEAGLISQRTRDALAAVKARGKRLGWANPARTDQRRATSQANAAVRAQADIGDRAACRGADARQRYHHAS